MELVFEILPQQELAPVSEGILDLDVGNIAAGSASGTEFAPTTGL